MNSRRLFPPSLLASLFLIACSPAGTRKEPSTETPPMGAMSESGDAPGTDTTPVKPAAPAEGLPTPALPAGTAPLDYASIPGIPLLDAPLADLKAAVPLLGQETWYGVYVMNQKVGFMSTAWSLEGDAAAPRLVQRQQFRMEMSVLGGKKVLELQTTAIYDAAGEGALLTHVTVQTADHMKRTVTLVRQPDGSHRATVESVAAGQAPAPVQTYTPDRPLGPAAESDLAFAWKLSRGPSAWNPGRAWRTRKFMSTEVTVAHEVGRVVDRVERMVDGKVRPFLVVETLSDNPKSRVLSVFNESGILELSRVGSIEMRHESKAKAAAGLGGELDTGFSAIIPLPLSGTPATSIARLVLGLDGPFPSPEFLNTRRYRLETVDGKRRLTLVVDDLEGLVKPDPATLPAEVRRYLKAEPNIESDDAGLVALAKQAARDAKTPAEVLKAVAGFVGDHVEDTLRSDVESARMVAQLRRGDCTEHSILATALFRALGYPARQVGGVGHIVLRGDADTLEGLGYHAWTQVWAGRWVDVDPTWRQAPADVTHVLMGAADDMEWLESLGTLKITVLQKELKP